MKGLVSVSNSSNTPLSNNRSTGRVVTAIHEQKLNLRDLMLVETGDPAALSISYEQVYDFDRNATVVSENGMLSESSLKFKEEFTNVRTCRYPYESFKEIVESKELCRVIHS